MRRIAVILAALLALSVFLAGCAPSAVTPSADQPSQSGDANTPPTGAQSPEPPTGDAASASAQIPDPSDSSEFLGDGYNFDIPENWRLSPVESGLSELSDSANVDNIIVIQTVTGVGAALGTVDSAYIAKMPGTPDNVTVADTVNTTVAGQDAVSARLLAKGDSDPVGRIVLVKNDSDVIVFRFVNTPAAFESISAVLDKLLGSVIIQ